MSSINSNSTELENKRRMEGWVLRKSSTGRSWSFRYLILQGNTLQVCRKEKRAPYRHLNIGPTSSVDDIQAGKSHWYLTVRTRAAEDPEQYRFTFATKAPELAREWHQAMLDAWNSACAAAEAAKNSALLPQRIADAHDTLCVQGNQASDTLSARSVSSPLSLRVHVPASIQAILAKAGQEKKKPCNRLVMEGGDDVDTSSMDEAVNFFQWRTACVEDGLRVRIDDLDFPTHLLAEAASNNQSLALAAGTCIVVSLLAWTFVVQDTFLAFLIGLAGACYVLRGHWMDNNNAKRSSSLQVAETVNASVDSLLDVLLDDKKWPLIDSSILDQRLVEQVDENSSIIHIKLRPIWKIFMWLKPRDLCLQRCCLKEDNGAALVVLQSTTSPRCQPTQGAVRAQLPGAVFQILPHKEKNNRSMVIFTAKYEPYWAGKDWLFPFQGYDLIMQMLNSVRAFKDAMEHQSYQFSNIDLAADQETENAGYQPGATEERVTEDSYYQPTVDGHGLVQDVKLLSCSTPRGYWAEPDASKFFVRGPNYLLDQVKQISGPAAFHLVGVDVLSFEDGSQRLRIAGRPDNIVYQMNKDAPPSEPLPYTFVVNLIIPCKDNLAVVCYFQPCIKSWREEKNNFTELLSDFIEADDSFRNSRFKILPHLVEGPYILRKLVNRPTIIGNKGLTVSYFRGENWFEVDIDVDSNTTARSVTGMAVAQVTKLVIDLAYIVQANEESELPENILCAVRFNHIDLSCHRRIPKDAPCTPVTQTQDSPSTLSKISREDPEQAATTSPWQSQSSLQPMQQP